jgi:hypothetical protein
MVLPRLPLTPNARTHAPARAIVCVREAGTASGRPETEASGGGEELAGKATNALGKARSAVKKSTR